LTLNAALDRPLFLRLFRNDVPVTVSSTLDAFQTADFTDYDDLDLTGLFPPAQVDPLGRAFSLLPNLTWTVGAAPDAQTIYGWIMYEEPDPDSVLIAGRRLTVPYTVNTEGQVIMVSVVIFLLRG